MNSISAAVRFFSPQDSAPCNVLGVTVAPLLRNAETDNHFGLFHATVPSGVGIPLHSHPDLEVFFVLEGQLEVLHHNGGHAESFAVGRDQGAYVPGNALHGFLNRTDTPARVLISCPRGLEEFLLEAGEPGAASPEPPSHGQIERVLAIARKHGQVFSAQ